MAHEETGLAEEEDTCSVERGVEAKTELIQARVLNRSRKGSSPSI